MRRERVVCRAECSTAIDVSDSQSFRVSQGNGNFRQKFVSVEGMTCP